MQANTIRRIDYWAGVPLCAALTLLRRVLPDRRRAPQRMAFLKFIEQGATVLAQDAISRAVAMVGRENVYFCVFKNNRAILDVLDAVPAGNILTIDDSTILRLVGGFLSALATLRANGVDTTIDMEFFSRASAIFAFLSGATTRIGLHRFTSELPYRGDLMTHRVQYNPYLHVSTQYSLLVEAAHHQPDTRPLVKASISPDNRTAAFTPTTEESERVRTLIGGVVGPVILLNPNASDLLPLRKWDPLRFVELAQRVLADEPRATVVITGAASEREPAEELCRVIGHPRAFSVAGQTTLRELMTLYTMASVLVTNDSGPAHFATLTPVPTIVLFGPETPVLFGPLSPATTVVWKQLACSPCVSVFNHRFSPCQDNVCMQAISVDEVYEAVRAALARQ